MRLDVLAYTGLRRSDAVRFGRQHVNSGWISIRTGKTGAVVAMPMRPALSRTLDAGPRGDLTYITGVSGKPLSAISFYLVFREACRAAGVTCSSHGVRKRVATRVAEAGGSNRELEALFGRTGGRMASLYTGAADPKRLAEEGMRKAIEMNNGRTSTPSPSKKVREKGRKGE